jgi:hypothetical protein
MTSFSDLADVIGLFKRPGSANKPRAAFRGDACVALRPARRIEI